MYLKTALVSKWKFLRKLYYKLTDAVVYVVSITPQVLLEDNNYY